MAQQRQSFRFRFPWSTKENPPPQSQPKRPRREKKAPTQPKKTRPLTETQIPSQPTTSPSTEKPPFKPAGIAQPQASSKIVPQSPSTSRDATESHDVSQTPSSSPAPSQAQTTSLPQSPSHKTPESRVSSKITSPSRAKTPTQPPAESQTTPSKAKIPTQPPEESQRSPSRAKTPTQPLPESQTSSQIRSPSHLASQPTRKTTPLVSSPSQKATQAQPTNGAMLLSSLTSDKSQPIDHKSSHPLSSSTPPQSNNSQQEPKGKVSQQPLQEPQPTLETSSSTHNALNNIAIKTPSETDREAPKEVKDVLLPVAMTDITSTKEVIGSYQKLDTNSNSGAPMPHSKFEVKSNEEEYKEIVELPKEETSKGEPVQKIVTEATVSEKQEKDAFKEEKRQQKQERMDTEEKAAFASRIRRKVQTSSFSQANLSNVFIKQLVSSAEEQAKLHKEIIPKIVHKMTSGHQTDETLVNVITLSGENRGATMHISSETEKKEAPIHIHRDYKINQDVNLETTTDGEVNTGGKRFKKNGERETSKPRAYVNSNVQSVNNSFVFNSSVTERDPGVEVVFSHHTAESIKRNCKAESPQTRKAKFTITPAEKLTHEHTDEGA